ncbi:MAG: glycoside hydrolase family 95 protein [Lachnospiraceae bacterium]|nr:glycoside hydrolase family 95 protein [Lachnospiraceae bacterium]
MSTLWYDTWAGNDWNRGFPVGNGRIGAMILGNASETRLCLNEDSIWSGGPRHRVNKNAPEELPKVRELIYAGRIPEAEELMVHAFSGVPESCRSYAPLGSLRVMFKGVPSECKTYRRELNLNDAVYTCKREFEDVCITETVFADYPDGVLVYCAAADRPEMITLRADLNCLPHGNRGYAENDTVYAEGEMVSDDGKYGFSAGVRAFAEGGTMHCEGRYVSVDNADSVTLVFAAESTFREIDTLAAVKKRLSVPQSPYERLLAAHLADYRALFGRTSLKLDYDKSLDLLPTDRRLARISENAPDNGLLCTYFDYGRYLLISSSRKGSLPANLQGIWNPHLDPPWGSKYTININLEMNYWPAERLGLAECAEPLFDLIRRMIPSGQKTAKEMYGCRGSVAHHNTDMWGDTAPQDEWIPGTYWVMGLAWLCTHIYTHSELTGDRQFLGEMYPCMKQAAMFFHDFCEMRDGVTTICPSVSPENTYILPDGTQGCACYNSAMDTEILRDLLTQTLEAAEIAGDCDDTFIEKTKELLVGLPKIGIGKHGQILEWEKDYDEAEPGHRHISHLYALFPSDQITPDGTPDLAEGCRVTLRRRLSSGGGHTGWSRAWILAMFARLWDGEECYRNWIALMQRSTLTNLLDNHPPFQIDGNFGSIAAAAEMLLQSNRERVILLPALPKAWSDGSVNGLHAVGGAAWSFAWKNGQITEFTVTAANDYKTVVVISGERREIALAAGETVNFTC